MQMEQLQKDMIAAMKAKDKPRKEAISSLVSAVKKAAIDAGCRDDIKVDSLSDTNCAISRSVFPSKITIKSKPPEIRYTAFTSG